MAKKPKPPVEKECPKCGIKHTRERSKYCSTKCGNSRVWTDEKKREQSLKIRRWKQTDEGEDNSFNILKNKKIPPTIPHPEKRLGPGQFSDGEDLWTIDPAYAHEHDDWN